MREGRSVAAWFGAIALLSCRGEAPAEPVADPSNLEGAVAVGEGASGADAEIEERARVAEFIAADAAGPILDEADRAFDDDRPVHAAEILRDRGVAATRESARHAATIEVASEGGRALRQALVRALVARADAVERMRDVLERGLVEDLALATAIRDRRRAEEALLEVASAAGPAQEHTPENEAR